MAAKTSENQGSNSLAAILFAVFAVAVIVAFLTFRGSDVGQLQKLVGNLGGGPLVGFEGFRDSVAGAIVAILIAISWFGVGSLVARLIKLEKSDDYSHILELARNTAIGAAIWSIIWFFLGLAGAYKGFVAVIAVFIGVVSVVLGIGRFRQAKDESRVLEKTSGFDKVLLVMIAIPLVLAFVASLAPPTAKDTLLYHFAVPKAFIAQHSNAFIDGNIASYLALGTEMHTVWAMLVGGFISPRVAETAAGAMVFLFFPLLLLTVFGWSRESGISRSWSLIALLIVASVPTAFHVASSGYIDIVLALFVTLAIYALCRW